MLSPISGTRFCTQYDCSDDLIQNQKLEEEYMKFCLHSILFSSTIMKNRNIRFYFPTCFSDQTLRPCKKHWHSPFRELLIPLLHKSFTSPYCSTPLPRRSDDCYWACAHTAAFVHYILTVNVLSSFESGMCRVSIKRIFTEVRHRRVCSSHGEYLLITPTDSLALKNLAQWILMATDQNLFLAF